MKISEKKYGYLVVLLFVLFVLKCGYIAFTLDRAIAPDEPTHFNQIQNFEATNAWVINPESLPPKYGQMSQTSFLYHLALGKIIKLIPVSDENEFYFLRFLNIILSCINVFIFLKLIELIFSSPLIRLIGLFAYTNILMVTLLSAIINYDNLFNLLAILLIYAVVKLFKSRDLKYFMYCLIFFSCGLLTKRAMLLFLPLLGLIISFIYVKKLKFNAGINSKNTRQLLFITALIVGLTSSFLIRNQILYGKPYLLSCEDIYDNEVCNTRASAKEFHKLKGEHKQQSRVSLFDYYNSWDDSILSGTFGVLGHQSMHISKNERQFLKFILLAALVLLIINIFYFDTTFFVLLLIISPFFAGTFFYNYLGYLNSGVIAYGIQGRYLFPILSVVIIVLLYSFNKMTYKKWWSEGLILLICSFLFFLDFPSYLMDEKQYYFSRIHALSTLSTSTVEKKYQKMTVKPTLYIDRLVLL